jgi:hypothetical protein
MKFLFLLWIAMASIFDASVWATAAWCVLYSFSNVSWLQCFWISLAIHLVGNLSFIKYISTRRREDFFSCIRRESMLVGLFIVSAPIISILPTAAAIVLLSLLQVWTNLETHWLHTWLLVTCLVYNLLRGRGTRRMALQAESKFLKSPGSIWRLRTNPGSRMVARDGAEQPHGQARGKFARSARKTNGPRSGRVIDV